MSDKVKASHLLLRYAGSMRATASRTREEAESGIQSIKEHLDAGGDFAALAAAHSDFPSGKDGGDLGEFGRGNMVKPFEDAAFGMQVGETSGIVETPFGFHIVRRTG